jgi:hypothetical protein
MSIEGRIAVDINFTDSATGAASSVKKIQLAGATAYSTGKVAVVSGTCSTSDTTITLASVGYTNAAGSAVSFSSVSRAALVVSGTNAVVMHANLLDNNPALWSVSGAHAVTGYSTNATVAVLHTINAGTAAYTAVFYGS